MTTSTVGLLAGLLLAIATVTGGLLGLLLGLVLGAVGYVLGAHFDGELNLSEMFGGRRRG